MRRLGIAFHRLKGSASMLIRALSVRAAPGLINLLSLTLAARESGGATYGLFSTMLATAGVIAGTAFGIGNLSIVAQYSSHAGRARERVYLWTLLSLWGGLAAVVLMGSTAASFWTSLALPTMALVLATSLRNLFQEITRARQAILVYGVSDLIQAVGFLGAVLLFVNGSTTPALLVVMFAVSNLPALLVNLADIRKLLMPARPSLRLCRQIVGMGGWLSLSNLTENILYTGARYVILAQAGTQALGVFSFAVDLAQRTVAFVVNAASFVYTPKAFALRRQEGDESFRKHLREGGWIASSAALATMVFVGGISIFEPTARLFPDVFDLSTFLMVACAATTNRLKKLLVDPVAMARQMSHRVAKANAVGAISGIALVALLSTSPIPQHFALGYLGGYVLMLIVSVFAIKGATRERTHPPKAHPKQKNNAL